MQNFSDDSCILNIFFISLKKKEMDKNALYAILNKWEHIKYDMLGPQAKSSLEISARLKQKIENRTINTEELYFIMALKNLHNL